MESRNKYIFTIISAWVFFILIILAISAYIYISGFIQLEKKVATDNSNRVLNVMIANLENVHHQNSEYSYWDDTFNFVKNKNSDYIAKNLNEDIFKSNKLNYIILLNNASNTVYAKGYDLTKSTYTNIPTDFTNFFKKEGFRLLNYPEEYNTIIKTQYGSSGFLGILNNSIITYFAINFVNNSDESENPAGAMIFGKILTPDFINQLSKQLNYKIRILSINDAAQTKHGKEIVDSLSSENTVFTEHLNADTLFGYVLIKDIHFQPMALLQVEIPRTLYSESRASFIKNSIMLLAFCLIGMFSMSILVYAFFNKQELITRSFERFVPHQLIDLLNKKNILEVILGTNSKRDISVLFMDIRNFTTISEGLTPQENFDFINTILREIAPIVIQNNGFIDKYIGDAIMALFPNKENNADNAVAAGMMILDEMDKINYTGKIKLSFPVKIGIGINTGSSILGIIGAEGRLEGTVISDAVNTASRIQSLTKVYDSSMLISEETYKNMRRPELYSITHIDDVQVKGKTTKISIYKVEKRR